MVYDWIRALNNLYTQTAFFISHRNNFEKLILKKILAFLCSNNLEYPKQNSHEWRRSLGEVLIAVL